MLLWSVLIALLNLAFYLFKPFGESFELVAMSLSVVMVALPLLTGWDAMRLHGTASGHGRAMLFLLLGFIGDILGNLVWLIMLALDMGTPTVSFGDVFWWAGALCWIIAIVYVLKTSPQGISRTALITACAVTVALWAGGLMLLVPVAAEMESLLELLVTVAYPLFDLVILSLLTFGIARMRSSQFGKTYSLLSVGIVIVAVGDLAYSLIASDYASGNLIDLTWNLGFLIMFYGFAYHATRINEITRAQQAPTQDRK